MNFDFTYVWTQVVPNLMFLSVFCWILWISVKKDFLNKYLRLDIDKELKIFLKKAIIFTYIVMFIGILINGLNVNFADTKEYRQSQNYQTNVSYQERNAELPKKVEVFNYKKEYKNIDNSITKEQNKIHEEIK